MDKAIFLYPAKAAIGCADPDTPLRHLRIAQRFLRDGSLRPPGSLVAFGLPTCTPYPPPHRSRPAPGIHHHRRRRFHGALPGGSGRSSMQAMPPIVPIHTRPFAIFAQAANLAVGQTIDFRVAPNTSRVTKNQSAAPKPDPDIALAILVCQTRIRKVNIRQGSRKGMPLLPVVHHSRPGGSARASPSRQPARAASRDSPPLRRPCPH